MSPVRARPLRYTARVTTAPDYLASAEAAAPRLGRDRVQVMLGTGSLAAIAILLVLAQVAPWRIALGVGARVVLYLSPRLRARRAAAPITLRGVFANRLALILAQGVLIAVTGGLESPLAPLLLGPTLGAATVLGRERRSVWLIAVAAGLTVLLALLPSSLRGPRIAAPYYTVLGAVALLLTLLMTWRGIGLLADAHRTTAHSLQRLREALLEQATARVRSLESISARVAHELKNPLTAVKGLLPLLARDAIDERARRRFEVVESEVARMEVLLREYLSFARPLDELELREVDLPALLGDVAGVLEGRAAAAQVGLVINVSSEAGAVAPIVGDPRRLREALLNLAANALEATPPGGRVELALRAVADRVELCVRDTGRGMSAATLGRLGTPFFTTRPGGTGLGVLLARTVFMQHGGTLSYTSQPERGTQARIELPRRPPVPAAAPAPAAAPTEPDPGGAA